MGIRQVVVSDISGAEVADEQHARVVVTDHPKLSGGRSVELDISLDEAEKFQTSTIELVNVTVHEPNKPPRRVVLEASTFNGLFKGVDMDQLVGNARSVAQESSRASGPRRARSTSSAAKGERVDYTSPEKFGQLHRGRVTEEEASLVRDNLQQANANREKAGQAPIDPNDEREKKRYGF
jgi:hypothetical protein